MQAAMLEQNNWAVVGATNNVKKFGYKIFKFMKNSGYNVFAVNPGLDEVLGEKCYASVTDLPIIPDVVDLVVPAHIGEQVVRECAEIGVKNVWLQPGAESDSLISLSQQLGLNIVYQACVIESIKKKGGS